MSNATPPGWYPDAAAPGTDRWWDGTAWTAHTRPAAAPQAFGPPEPVATAPQDFRLSGPATTASGDGGNAAGRGTTRIVALAVAGLVVVGAAVTGAVLLGRDDDGRRPEAGPSGSVAPTTTVTDTPSPTGSPAEDDPKVLVDQLNGITLPIPDGWEKPDRTVEPVLTMRTVNSYACPGSSSDFCYHGTVTSRIASATDITSAEKLAEHDIATAADGAYEKNLVGNRIHGGITSHKVLDSASVSVAGRAGHQVRWRVETGKGPGGYVQSLVFPSTIGTESLIIVRYAFDAGPDGPPLSLMDTITKAIRPIGDSATSGGAGSSIAP
ncbi:DUF2510 domain-containing protein [Streptomyces atratus]|uniref:DUF2510 domain-containing protein n=1 Tax=Streptomyces atratus TaxID=1893 RepID=UPI0021A6093B|nr:DUF2510 domain-containing protein [Streptomyces atratus]MCT2547928.1 DUF2510 domain-containing protein [Streptomyces atratus]